MLGRIVLPIVFIENGREIRVTELNELKRFFVNDHVQVLIRSLKDGKLEQFFYGHGKDEIKELISELKNKGENEIRILNAVAEKLGIPKLDENLAKKLTTSSELKTLRDIFLSNQYEFFLTTDELNVNNESINLFGRKKIVGTGLSKIRVNNLEIFGNGSSDECVFENLNFESIHEETIKKDEFGEYPHRDSGSISIQNTKIVFKNIRFFNIDLEITDSDIELINCVFDNCFIFISGCSGTIENSTIDLFFDVSDSNINIKNSRFTDVTSDNRLNNCSFEIIDSEFSGIVIENSKGTISRTKIFDGFKSGINSLNSEITLIDSQIYNCSESGLSIDSGSKMKIINSEIFNNSVSFQLTSESPYPEIFIINSSAEIVKSKIHDGKFCGIYSVDSNVYVKESSIYNNYQVGIASENSQISIEDSHINHNNLTHENIWVPQINLKKSNCTIKNSTISDGFGVGIYCEGSNLTIVDGKIQKNRNSGIWVRDNSTFKIENSEIGENGSYELKFGNIILENSSGVISRSKIHQSNIYGIHSINSKLSIFQSKIFQNKEGIFFAENSDFTIENSEIYENGKVGERDQVILLNSKGKIANSTIYKGFSNGIGCYKSVLEVINSSIYENLGEGIKFIDSKIHLSAVRTWGNKEGAFFRNLPGLTYDKSCSFSDLK